MSKSLVYPSKHDPQAVTVGRESLDGLEPGQDINDEIVEFFIQHLRLDYLPGKLNMWKAADGSPPTFSFASTFFYTKLKMPDGLKNIGGWLEKLDIPNSTFTFIPVNQRSSKHWNLVIVHSTRKIIYLLDSLELYKDEDILYDFLYSFFFSLQSLIFLSPLLSSLSCQERK
jgi:Ulp1 family protease